MSYQERLVALRIERDKHRREADEHARHARALNAEIAMLEREYWDSYESPCCTCKRAPNDRCPIPRHWRDATTNDIPASA